MDWLVAAATDVFNTLGRGVFAKLVFWGLLAFPILAVVGYFALVRHKGKVDQPTEVKE
jgi:hypothetical protein